MGEWFSQKSKTLLEETVKQHSAFSSLPEETKKTVETEKENLPFFQKLATSVRILLVELSFMKRFWILFSILIPILLLLQKEGAQQAAWLLPIIALCYLLENSWQGYPSQKSAEFHLFPKEEVLIQDYVEGSMSRSISGQKEQLTHAWHLYLIDQWLKETPADDLESYHEQVVRGKFAFNVARLKARARQPKLDLKQTFRRRESLPLLAFYVAWNILFAYGVNRRHEYKPNFQS